MLATAQNLDLMFRGLKAVFDDAFTAAPSHMAEVAMQIQSGTSEEN
jgi:phage major head subunit gpT-like protein